jgi:glycosyltransferase involved in cell wall biosynthesis
MDTLVSILIPCFNAEEWVAEAISSALAQTWPNKEVIVIDDGSTDRSLEIIRSFGDRIHFEVTENRGANVARNRLLELARGEWLQYLDADDYLLETKIADQLASVGDGDNPDIIYSPMTIEPWREGRAGERVILPVPTQDPWLLLARWQMPGTHAVLMRRSAILDVGGWKPDQPCCQEYELFLRLLIVGKRFVYRPQQGAIYRYWSTNTVSHRNPLRTIVNLLAIIDAAEHHLEEIGTIDRVHREAFAFQRIETARTLYQLDRSAAMELAAKAGRIHPMHTLPLAPCFPMAYRLLYHTLGFKVAEMVAGMARTGRRRPA